MERIHHLIPSASRDHNPSSVFPKRRSLVKERASAASVDAKDYKSVSVPVIYGAIGPRGVADSRGDFSSLAYI